MIVNQRPFTADDAVAAVVSRQRVKVIPSGFKDRGAVVGLVGHIAGHGNRSDKLTAHTADSRIIWHCKGRARGVNHCDFTRGHVEPHVAEVRARVCEVVRAQGHRRRTRSGARGCRHRRILCRLVDHRLRVQRVVYACYVVAVHAVRLAVVHRAVAAALNRHHNLRRHRRDRQHSGVGPDAVRIVAGRVVYRVRELHIGKEKKGRGV